MTPKIYDYDRTGNAPENLVPDENHVVGTSKVFIAKAGAFYTSTLIVKQGTKTLVKGIDWKPVVFNSRATEESGLEVHTGIILTSIDSQQPIVLRYNAVGGEYANYQEVILDMIERLGLESSMVLFGDLVGVPDVFAPAPHKTVGEDLIGLSRIEEMLARLTDAVDTGQSSKIAELRKDLAAKVDRGGRMTLRPDNGSITVPVDAPYLDMVLPRSESQNANVSLEITFIVADKPYKGIITYNERNNTVEDINGYYMGSTILINPVGIAGDVGNDNVTIIRLGNMNGGPLPIDYLYVIAITTTDELPNHVYGSIDVLETPLPKTLPLTKLDISSGSITESAIADILESNANLDARITEMNAELDKVGNVLSNNKIF